MWNWIKTTEGYINVATIERIYKQPRGWKAVAMNGLMYSIDEELMDKFEDKFKAFYNNADEGEDQ